MPVRLHIGCCGWSYLNEKDFSGAFDSVGRLSQLQFYAKLFDTVEINSTFYRLPRISTAEKWRREVDEVNPGFEFTVKAYRGITHLHRFRKKESMESFYTLREIISALGGRIVLFQSPASFSPSPPNVEAMEEFFARIDLRGLTVVWEPRGKWYENADLIERVCIDCNLVHCVDPFRNRPLIFEKGGTAYFRLHGFGKPSMYRYDFSIEELKILRGRIADLPPRIKHVYVFFNNDRCYQNGRSFLELIR